MKKATAALSLPWLSLCAYLLRREYFKLNIAEGEGAAGVYPAEFLNFKSETQENIDNCLTKIRRVLLCKVER